MGVPFQLPLGGIPPVDRLSKSTTAAEGETLPDFHPDYLRLFGATRPDQVIQPIDPTSLRDDGNLGPPHPHFRDPNEGAAGLLSPQHPSARSLADIAALRQHHVAKGHTPESDAQHGPVFFMSAARAWWERAKAARTVEARRKCMVAAAAMFVAMIDAHDFTQQQQQGTAPDE